MCVSSDGPFKSASISRRTIPNHFVESNRRYYFAGVFILDTEFHQFLRKTQVVMPSVSTGFPSWSTVKVSVLFLNELGATVTLLAFSNCMIKFDTVPSAPFCRFPRTMTVPAAVGAASRLYPGKLVAALINAWVVPSANSTDTSPIAVFL